MYAGNKAELKMKAALLDMPADTETYRLHILKQEPEQLYLLLEEGDLKDLSLDVIYECGVIEGESRIYCEGRIRERYICQTGPVVVFRIQKGFYEISLK